MINSTNRQFSVSVYDIKCPRCGATGQEAPECIDDGHFISRSQPWHQERVDAAKALQVEVDESVSWEVQSIARDVSNPLALAVTFARPLTDAQLRDFKWRIERV